MIYIFGSLPKAVPPHFELAKAFNNFSTPAEVARKIQDIQKLRDNFYTVVAQMEQKAPNQMVTDWDWMPCMQYLQQGPELLEVGVKNANFPFNFKWTSVLSPSKEIIINDDNEVAASIEMIISRYSYALMVLKSCSGHIYQFREAARNKAKDQAVVLSKDILERLRNATIRVYKLWGVENLVIVVSYLTVARPQRSHGSS